MHFLQQHALLCQWPTTTPPKKSKNRKGSAQSCSHLEPLGARTDWENDLVDLAVVEVVDLELIEVVDLSSDNEEATDPNTNNVAPMYGIHDLCSSSDNDESEY